MSSLSHATVFRVSNLKKHENADMLMVSEYEGCPFIVNKNDTKDGDLRIFCAFDMIAPDHPDIAEFVRGKRIRPMKLRGVFSMAVCIPLPPGEFAEGEDVTERLGFSKWEPDEFQERDGITVENSDSGYSCKGPSLNVPKYDLESLRKYHHHFVEGEKVIITAKLHGENLAVVYWDGSLHVRSRNRWIAEGENKWWQSVRKYDWGWLEKRPGLVAFSEKYGNVNKFRYDCKNGEQLIRIFDLYDAAKMRFLDYDEHVLDLSEAFSPTIVPDVPVLYRGSWLGLLAHKDLTEGKAVLGGDCEEGFVVEPVHNRYIDRLGRLKLKYHSEKYLLFNGKQK